MAREVNEILQELNIIAQDLEHFDYIKEASDIRNLSDMIRTGGTISQRVRKVSAQDSSIKNRSGV